MLEQGPPWTLRRSGQFADLGATPEVARVDRSPLPAAIPWATISAPALDLAAPHSITTEPGRGSRPRTSRCKAATAGDSTGPSATTDLQPWYDRMQAEMGISGDADAEIWRGPGDPYPMPAIPRFAQGELLARGFAKLGKPVAPLPVIVNSVPYRRPPRVPLGWLVRFRLPHRRARQSARDLATRPPGRPARSFAPTATSSAC